MNIFSHYIYHYKKYRIMRLKHYIFSSLLASSFAAAPLLTGCANYDAEVEQMKQEQVTFELRLNVGGEGRILSRTAITPPQGGENGDGREYGFDYEYDIKDLNILYYYGENINAVGETDVYELAWIPNITEVQVSSTDNQTPNTGDCPDETGCVQRRLKLTTEQTGTFKYVEGQQFIIIANYGKEIIEDKEPMKLSAIRDLPIYNAWGGANKFVMSNEHDSKYEEKADGDGHDLMTVTIERVAARIDFCVNGSDSYTEGTVANPARLYHVKNDAGTKQYGEVYLTHVRPFNVRQAGKDAGGSYAIKRNSSGKYLAVEQAGGTDIIVEPTTYEKSPEKLTNLYGATRHSAITATYADEHPVRTEDALTTVGKETFYVLDYAQENTMSVENSNANYATGYFLKATYKPDTVYNSVTNTYGVISLEDGNKAGTNYTLGQTFFRYRPLVKDFDESQCKYFCGTDGYTLATTYGDYILKTKGVPYVVETYNEAICYYQTFARHDNPGLYPKDTTEVGITPMEFGIVRNNIYRLKVSFTGPGSTTPNENFETLTVRPYLYTRPWYKVVHEEINI